MDKSQVSEEIWTRVDGFTKDLTRATRRVRQELSAQNLTVAGEAAQSLVEAISGLISTRDEIALAVQSWKERLDRQFLELESDLRAECARRSWKVDGSWPSIYVQRAIHVEVAETDRTVRVNGTKLKWVSAASIVAAIEPIAAGLIPRNFEPQEFIEQLAEAYDETRSNSTQLPIFDVYRAFVVRMQPARFWRDPRPERFNGLTLEQLRARLSLSLEAGCIATKNGRSLVLYPPLDPKDGLFLYQPIDRRFAFVGRIEFRRA
jgi:hypothetical protein